MKVPPASMPCSIGALALAAGLLAFASAASAVANLMDVRVGLHGDHTRLVIETDGAAPFVVDPTDREVLVHVDVAATAEAVTAKSPHLIWVKVEPTAIGTDVRIQLKQPVEVKTLVLTRPDRIVLDFYPKAGGAEPLPAPEVIPEEDALPDTAAAEPEPEEPPALDEPGLPEEEPEPAEEPVQLTLPEDAAEPEPDTAAEAERQAQLAGEPAPAGEPSEAIEGRVVEPEAPVRPTTPVAPAPSGSLFGSPFALGVAAIALLAVFVLLRRRMRRGELRRVSPLPEEDHEPFEPPARAVAVGEPSATGESLFDVEPEAYAPEAPDEAPLARGMVRADADSDDETERRIAHVEKRLEELADAKDRLERQVAAQTEELRVQRAAIARTQRVLRTVAPKADDESSETVRG